ncbi:hypothetical protein MRB53_023716 [Persea americana]|uniref:Uncharacterized protein n=1 Tax=Persea americana TaxID=3435 RepID=A0ACC2LB66_PERAE|nr:hypothetical protein MRB53_023716 [Persea americana]
MISPSLNSCPWNFWLPCSRVLKGGLSAIHVPYAYGFAIILLTVIVKVAGYISFDEAAVKVAIKWIWNGQNPDVNIT